MRVPALLWFLCTSFPIAAQAQVSPTPVADKEVSGRQIPGLLELAKLKPAGDDGAIVLDLRKKRARKVLEIRYDAASKTDELDAVVRKSGSRCRLSLNRVPERLGWLSEASPDVLFFSLETGGTGGESVGLHALSLRRCELATLHFDTSYAVSHPYSTLRYGSNHGVARLQALYDSLERLKSDFGYADEATLKKQTGEWRNAYYFWRLDNPALDTGAGLIQRRFFPNGFSDLDEKRSEHDLTLGGFVFRSVFKAGVVGFDTEKKTAFVVWAPESSYDATNLKLGSEGKTLTIETPDTKGVISVNTETWLLTHQDSTP